MRRRRTRNASAARRADTARVVMTITMEESLDTTSTEDRKGVVGSTVEDVAEDGRKLRSRL